MKFTFEKTELAIKKTTSGKFILEERYNGKVVFFPMFDTLEETITALHKEIKYYNSIFNQNSE